MQKAIGTEYQEALVRRLVALRKAAGLKQRDLARRLRRVPSVVAHLELGERRIDLVEFFFLCVALEIDPEKAAAQMMRDFKELRQAGEVGAPRKKR